MRIKFNNLKQQKLLLILFSIMKCLLMTIEIKLKMNFFYQCQLLMIVLVIFVESIVFTELFLRIKMKIKNLKFPLEEIFVRCHFR